MANMKRGGFLCHQWDRLEDLEEDHLVSWVESLPVVVPRLVLILAHLPLVQASEDLQEEDLEDHVHRHLVHQEEVMDAHLSLLMVLHHNSTMALIHSNSSNHLPTSHSRHQISQGRLLHWACVHLRASIQMFHRQALDSSVRHLGEGHLRLWA